MKFPLNPGDTQEQNPLANAGPGGTVPEWRIRVISALRKAAVIAVLGTAGCVTTPPKDTDDLCAIFREKPSWYRDSNRAYKKWGVPEQVQMAIMHQESRFVARAKPPRIRLLGFIPTVRPSSAYGYPQAKDSTWEWYTQKTGNRGADRDNFADATDFIGWYGAISQKTLGISKWDARNQYLAYHEGHGGYRSKSYRDKGWLIRVADRTEHRAQKYATQLASCRDQLEGGWTLWPF